MVYDAFQKQDASLKYILKFVVTVKYTQHGVLMRRKDAREAETRRDFAQPKVKK